MLSQTKISKSTKNVQKDVFVLVIRTGRCSILIYSILSHFMDGWMDGWMGGWVDRWVDGWIFSYNQSFLQKYSPKL